MKIALVIACIIALIPGVAFASTGVGGKESCPPATLNCREGSDRKENPGREVTSTKDVDNEIGEEKQERGEEYENEAQEEKHETVKQEQAEQVTTTSHEKSASEGGQTGAHENNK